jgi:hypothetical protein
MALNQVPDLVRQQKHSDDLSSDTTLSSLSRPSRNRVSIPSNHVIADQWNKSPRKIAVNVVSLFGHATHSAAVRSFPYAFGTSLA